MRTLRKKAKQWLQSVRGLIVHVQLHRAIHEHIKVLPIEQRGPAMLSLRQQEGMVGHCLLHVLCVYPLGSGFLADEDEEAWTNKSA